MGSYNLAYRLFHIAIFIVLLVLYALLEYYIIPDFVQPDKKALAATYTNYGLTICISLLTFGSMVTEYIDKRMEMFPPTIKGARR
jgi:fructose-1,6-bisphosphatase